MLFKFFSEYQTLEVHIEAKYIEDGTVVTKEKGTKEYTLKRNIKIYGENQQEIKCEADTVYLVDSTGTINCITDSTVLKVQAKLHELAFDLLDFIDSVEDK